MTAAKEPSKIKIEDQLNKHFESKNWICDTTYAFEKYGFKTKIGIQEGIKKLK